MNSFHTAVSFSKTIKPSVDLYSPDRSPEKVSFQVVFVAGVFSLSLSLSLSHALRL